MTKLFIAYGTDELANLFCHTFDDSQTRDVFVFEMADRLEISYENIEQAKKALDGRGIHIKYREVESALPKFVYVAREADLEIVQDNKPFENYEDLLSNGSVYRSLEAAMTALNGSLTEDAKEELEQNPDLAEDDEEAFSFFQKIVQSGPEWEEHGPTEDSPLRTWTFFYQEDPPHVITITEQPLH